MPLRAAFEELMVELEGGHRAVTLPSGLAAVAMALVVVPRSGRPRARHRQRLRPARRFCMRTLARFGVETTFYDPLIGAGIEALMKPNTRAVYLENPGSLTFEVQDFPAIARVAHAHGAAVLHDNTWATGMFFRSFDHGADLVIQAATKYPGGHSDVLIGAVVANEKWWPQPSRHLARLRAIGEPRRCLPRDPRHAHDGNAHPRHQASALQVAERLEKHPAVKRVLHPALPGDPGHALWKRDFLGSTGLMGVELAPVQQGRSSRRSSTASSSSRSATAGAATRASSRPPTCARGEACVRGRAARSFACRSASRIRATSSRTWSAASIA